jgi:hypothetical protein
MVLGIITTMKTRLVYSTVLVAAVLLGSCGREKKQEEAKRYYDKVYDVFYPHIQNMSTVLEESGKMMMARSQATGSIKLAVEDSVKIVGMFEDFQKLAEKTLRDTHNLPAFEEFDLKQPTLDFVTETSGTISDTFHQMVLPSQDVTQRQNVDTLAALHEKITRRRKEAEAKYLGVQRDFSNHFGLAGR